MTASFYLKSTSEQINGVWKYTVTIFIADYGECVYIPMLFLQPALQKSFGQQR